MARGLMAWIASIAIASVAHAWPTNRAVCVRYYIWQQTGEWPAEGPVAAFEFAEPQPGIVQFIWRLTNDAPTAAWCETNSTAAAAAWHTHKEDEQAPDSGWDRLTRRERFLLRCLWELAKQHWPNLTLQQYRAQLRTIWEQTQ